MRIEGLYRLVSAVPPMRVGNPSYNVDRMMEMYAVAVKRGAVVVLFPELSVTGYTCGDLFEQQTLLTAALAGLERLRAATVGQSAVLIAGLPLLKGTRLFNVAAVLQDGRLLAFVGKTYLPNYREFYEKRQFCSIREHDGSPVEINGELVPLGQDILLEAGGVKLGIELSEDLWVVTPPSNNLALQGAQVICNLSAEPEMVTKAECRRKLVVDQSARLTAVYMLAGAGVHESTSDLVFSGHAMIAAKGRLLAENQRFEREGATVTADVKINWLDNQRRSWTSHNEVPTTPVRTVKLAPLPEAPDADCFALAKHPFVPQDAAALAARCQEIFTLQATGLAKRLQHCRAKRLVIGLSGGLDSTLALLAATWCCDMLELPRTTILGVTMPGMGTTSRTKDNAVAVAGELGVELRIIDIKDAVTVHFRDIGHDPDKLDVVYENAQARERTQILMDLANATGGLVIGTGDLSEIALGWSTFNGDHMSMYSVNCGVPKTLVRHLIEYYASVTASPELARLLLDVNATPVSPELLPGVQHTEDILGNYELHDFFLYYFLKYGESPNGLLALAMQAFKDDYEEAAIRRTLDIFVKRFFSQQFKRNAMPDGPKIGTIALSPRGDWRMPADADAAAWLTQ